MTRISLTQLASLSEDVLEKASQNPTAARLVQSATQAEGPHRRPDKARARARSDGEAHRRARGARRQARDEEAACGTEGCPELAARRLARTRHADPQGPRHDLEGRRGRTDLLALDLDRQVLVCVDRQARRAHDFDLRVRHVLALVDLRRRRQEVDLRRRRRSGRRRTARRRALRPGASIIPPPCQTPFATTTSCIRPRRSPPSNVTLTSVFSHSRNTRVSA